MPVDSELGGSPVALCLSAFIELPSLHHSTRGLKMVSGGQGNMAVQDLMKVVIADIHQLGFGTPLSAVNQGLDNGQETELVALTLCDAATCMAVDGRLTAVVENMPLWPPSLFSVCK